MRSDTARDSRAAHGRGCASHRDRGRLPDLAALDFEAHSHAGTRRAAAPLRQRPGPRALAERRAARRGVRMDRTLPALLGRTPGRPRHLRHRKEEETQMKAATAPTAVVVRRTIAASAEDLVDDWLDPAALAVWMRPGGINKTTASVDARVGGRYEIIMQGDATYPHTGEDRVIDRPKRLVFTSIS